MKRLSVETLSKIKKKLFNIITSKLTSLCMSELLIKWFAGLILLLYKLFHIAILDISNAFNASRGIVSGLCPKKNNFDFD